MVMMTSVFAGILTKAAATITNTGAKMWVMDPSVTNVQSSIPLPDYILDAVRSTPGVRYAVPLYSGGGLVKLASGRYQAVTVLGLDDTSLYGRPNLLEGKIDDIYAESGFIVVKDSEYAKLDSPKLGQTFEINDNRGKIVGIAQVPSGGLFGVPTLYTTYSRAVQYLPSTRYTASFILVEPKSPEDIPRIQQAVARLGYVAKTEDQFVAAISDFYKYKTGLGTNILLMTVISFVVGLSISGQTFYSFTLENLDRFGALKAIGAKARVLVYMILFQVAIACFSGYGLGVGLCAGLVALAKLRLPNYASTITFGTLGFALLMTFIIAAVSSVIAIRRVLKVQPFEIFRA
jgi:putative ABC transport system permease protein